VGDLVEIKDQKLEDQRLEVLRMHLTYSLFRNKGKVVQIPHTDLQKGWITNVTRGKRWGKWKFKQEYMKESNKDQDRKGMKSLLDDYSILLRHDKSTLKPNTLANVKDQLNKDFSYFFDDVEKRDNRGPPGWPKPVLDKFLREGPVVYHDEGPIHYSDWGN